MSARFIDAFRKGLDGVQASWANRKYHGQCTLPSDIMRELPLNLRMYIYFE